MLKADMRKYILEGRTFDDFMRDKGEELFTTYSLDTLQRVWSRTSTQFVDRDEWIRYLKKCAADDARQLEEIADELNKEGFVLNGTRAGGIIARMLDKQRQSIGVIERCVWGS